MADNDQLCRQSESAAAVVVDYAGPTHKKLSLEQNFSWMFCTQMASGALRGALLLVLAVVALIGGSHR